MLTPSSSVATSPRPARWSATLSCLPVLGASGERPRCPVAGAGTARRARPRTCRSRGPRICLDPSLFSDAFPRLDLSFGGPVNEPLEAVDRNRDPLRPARGEVQPMKPWTDHVTTDSRGYGDASIDEVDGH